MSQDERAQSRNASVITASCESRKCWIGLVVLMIQSPSRFWTRLSQRAGTLRKCDDIPFFRQSALWFQTVRKTVTRISIPQMELKNLPLRPAGEIHPQAIMFIPLNLKIVRYPEFIIPAVLSSAWNSEKEDFPEFPTPISDGLRFRKENADKSHSNTSFSFLFGLLAMTNMAVVSNMLLRPLWWAAGPLKAAWIPSMRRGSVIPPVLSSYDLPSLQEHGIQSGFVERHQNDHFLLIITHRNWVGGTVVSLPKWQESCALGKSFWCLSLP